MGNISKLVAEKKGYTNLLNELNENLSGSELNTFLLGLFRERAKKITPTELLKHFEKNRFTFPSSVETIDFKEFEIRCLKLAGSRGFVPITLSPLTPFGTCSAVGFVDQNNVVTALRGTEIVSDATNVFALLIASEFKKKKQNSVIKYAATHRHVRSQAFSSPGLTPHFSIFCMATGGMDTGNFSFELEQLSEHMTAHLTILSNEFSNDKLFIRIYLKEENEVFDQKLKDYLKILNVPVTYKIERELKAGDYYKRVQFKFFSEHKGKEINLSDGGFVDWKQKLIPNRKHRLMISAVGTELIHKIKMNLL